MSILSELTTLLETLGVQVETGIFSDVAPDDYAVITPLYDNFELFSDNLPEYETQEVRLSLFSQNNYTALKSKIVKALLSAEFTITARQYIGHEDVSLLLALSSEIRCAVYEFADEGGLHYIPDPKYSRHSYAAK